MESSKRAPAIGPLNAHSLRELGLHTVKFTVLLAGRILLEIKPNHSSVCTLTVVAQIERNVFKTPIKSAPEIHKLQIR